MYIEETAAPRGAAFSFWFIRSSIEVDFTSKSEIVAADIRTIDHVYRLIVAYFSPSGSAAQLLSNKEQLIQEISAISNPMYTTIIAGDMNLPSLDWANGICPGLHSAEESKESLFYKFCAEHGLSQHVKTPTRLNSILDIVLCADESVLEVEVVNSPIKTDHRMVCFKIQVLPSLLPPPPADKLDFSNADYESMRLTLDLTDWNRFFSSCPDVNEMFNRLVELLHTLIEANTPLKSSNLIRLNEKISVIQAKIRISTDDSLTSRLQLKLTKMCRRIRVLKERSVVANPDLRSVHNYVRSRLITTDSLSAIRRPDGSFSSSDNEAAELLRDHFANTYPTVAELRHRESRLRPPTSLSTGATEISDVDVSPDNLVLYLSRLNSRLSDTPDHIPSFVYKRLGRSVCVPLSIIFRRSLEDSTVPELFRVAIVCPVHKKGKRTEPCNKRPVSLTVVASKLLESVLCSSIYVNANCQNLLHDRQFAYRPGKSAPLQLLTTQFEWASMLNDGKNFDAVYFDFKSAFEMVTHDKLIALLPSYGVGSRLVNWIRDYLQCRSFRVRVNGSLSSSCPISSGCPQGTCIGPLMFLLYIDSLKTVMPENVHFMVYADDIRIYCEVDSSSRISCLDVALLAFGNWCESLDLKLSVEKCMVLHFGSSNPRRSYSLYGSPIPSTTSIRDLGVLTCNNLKYSAHTVEISKRSAQRSNFLLRSFCIPDPELYMRLFRIYVSPIIMYASPVWFPGLCRDKSLLDRIVRKYRRRVAFKCNVSIEDVPDLDIIEEFELADTKMMRIISRNSDMFNEFFNVITTQTRSQVNVVPKFIALRKNINDLFFFRATRAMRCPRGPNGL